MSKMMVISERFIESLKEKEYLSTDEAIKILGKGILTKNTNQYMWYEVDNFKRLVAVVLQRVDGRLTEVVFSKEIPEERKARIFRYVSEWYLCVSDKLKFPKVVAAIARHGGDKEKIFFAKEIEFGKCEELLEEIALNSSTEVMKNLLASIEKRIQNLRRGYAYEGEIKEEILTLKNFALAVSHWECFADEIREMAKYAAL